MGLGIDVGILVDLPQGDPEGSEHVRKELAAISDALVAAGLPGHREPEAGIEAASYDLGPYTSLHALRRIGAHLSEGPDLPPPAGEDAPDDPVLERRYRDAGRFARLLGSAEGPRAFAHLIDHADDGGYCVPVGFTPAIEHRTLDFHTAMALVAAGLGVALVPRLGQAVVPPGAVVRPLHEPAPARHVFAATRAGAERRPTVAAVLDALAPPDPGSL